MQAWCEEELSRPRLERRTLVTNKCGFVAVAAAVLMLSSMDAATAEESAVIEPGAAPARAERNHSLNLDIGALVGAPSLAYEYMWADGQALVLEVHAVLRPEQENGRVGIGGVIGLVLEASGVSRPSYGDGSAGIGGAIGYRRHWRRQQDSGFFGVHAGYDIGESVVENTDIAWALHQTLYVVGNIGRRWLVGNNFNITARIGAGLAYRSVADRWEAEDVSSVRFLDDLLDRFPVTVDGELSLGYTF